MKIILKFIYYILLYIIIFIPFSANAASGNYSISSNSSVTIDNTISVTFTILGKNIYYWNAYITYDTSKLQLINGSTIFETTSLTEGGQNKVSKTLKFKAKKTGDAWVKISPGEADLNLNWDNQQITFSSKRKTITVTEKKVVTYSSNNYLKSLEVENYKITPNFDKNTKEYNVELPAKTTKIKIKATSEDSKASISGTGEKSVSEGANKLTVKVTAENGNTKEYIINAKVKELDPVEITINNQKYIVIRKKEQLPKTASNLYSDTTTKINNEEIPALKNEITNIILVGLKDITGNTELYTYNNSNNSFTLYKELIFNKLTIMPIDEDITIPKNYSKSTIKINDQNITAYKNNNNYPIFMGLNLETGEKNLYTYDEKENTIQRYNNNEVEDQEQQPIKNDESNLLYITISMGSLLIITYLAILINLIKKSKKPTKIKLNYKK